ncbi:MAG: serine protease [Rhodocyclaceae bacterium]
MLLLAVALLPDAAQAGLPDTAATVKSSLVVVGTYQRTRSPAFVPLGTGFVVGDGRTVATNAHVRLRQQNTEQFEIMVVVLPSQPNVPREVQRVAIDELHDLAVLRIREGAPLPALPMATTPAREGQGILLMGFPLPGLLGLTPALQAGVISAIAPISIPAPRADRLEAAVIRQMAAGAYPIYVLDAVARPGNSGSPVVDIESGQVLGVVSGGMVRQTREPGMAEPTGITYAIPVEHLRRLLQERD